MSEYEEEFEDDYESDEDDFDPVGERLDALEEVYVEQQEVAEVNRLIGALERQHGVTFSPAETQEIGSLIDAGYDPQAAYEEVAPGRDSDFEEQFNDAVERREQREGRSLLDVEIDNFWQDALDQDDPTVAGRGQVIDLDKSNNRADYIDAKVREQEQATAPEPDDTPLDFDDSADRVKAMDHMLAGGELVEATEADE